MLTKYDFLLMKKKQEELGLTDDECSAVVEHITQYIHLSEKQCELLDFLLEWLEKRQENSNEQAS
jgi:hypothetical protein